MKTNEILQLEVVIGKVQSLVDKGLKLDVITPELHPDDVAKVFAFKNKGGFMIFKEAKIQEEDIENLPEELKEFKSDKTPSQRLRAVLYKIWNNTTSKQQTFDEFYKDKMNKIIEAYKEKI